MTKKNLLAESLVWIIVWVFILSFVILWIGKLISYSQSLTLSFNEYTKVRLLKANLSNILKTLDISKIQENEAFYIHKDPSTHTFTVFTWTTNKQYKYVDSKWEGIADISTYEWNIYSRKLYIEREDTSFNSKNQIIKASIKRLIRK